MGTTAVGNSFPGKGWNEPVECKWVVYVEALIDEIFLAGRHVTVGLDHLARQRALIVKLQSDGHDTSEARELLQVLEQSQALHIAFLAYLRAQVDARSGTGRGPDENRTGG